MPLLSCVVSLKTRIVRILFSCMLPQTDNCCPTRVYRHLQCMSLLIDVSGVLRRHYTIESFYDRKLWFLLWCLSLSLSLNSCFFTVYFRYILECDILWMYLFLPYCVRKWHNKTVQSINQSLKYGRRIDSGGAHISQNDFVRTPVATWSFREILDQACYQLWIETQFIKLHLGYICRHDPCSARYKQWATEALMILNAWPIYIHLLHATLMYEIIFTSFK